MGITTLNTHKLRLLLLQSLEITQHQVKIHKFIQHQFTILWWTGSFNRFLYPNWQKFPTVSEILQSQPTLVEVPVEENQSTWGKATTFDKRCIMSLM